MELGPGTRFSHFEIVSRLGAGGMGEVYRAYDHSLKRHVALKILPRQKIATDEMLRRFAREARAASSLNHPNIITVYEIGQVVADDAIVDFMAMELVEGETLRSFLSRRVEMPKALHYLAQIADGLAKAHAAGILHRDLKPENIMITSDGFAKILDFGLAKTSLPESVGEGEIEANTISLPGVVMGTVGYMAPEQVRGSAIDQRSDIFSFGCILYEVATRRQPFRGNSAVDTFHKIVYEPPPPIGEVDPPVPETLRRVILKCLAKDPEERFQSSKEIAIDLREIRREYESGEHLSDLSPTKSLKTTRPRARWFWIAAAAALMLVAAILTWSQRTPRNGTADRARFESMTIDRLSATSNVQSAAVSPDGRYVAHVESTPKGDVILVRQVATGSEIEAAPPDGDSYGELSFSQDSEYILYVHRTALRRSPALGGSGKILIDKFSYPVSFSPDGKRCAFVRDGSLFVANIDGSGERRIATSTNLEVYVRPAWSPRGDVIACTRKSWLKIEMTDMWIEIVRANDSAGHTPPTILGERWFQITSLGWLPDGSGIAVSASHRPLIEKQLYEISYPEGRTKRLTNDLFEYEGASITADGRALVSRQTDKRSSIWLVSRDHPENARKVLEGVGPIRHITALPDGGFLYGASSGGNADIWRSTIDGMQRKQLTDDAGDDLMPTVSPDARTIAFISDRSGQTAVWMMDADGAHQTRLTSEGAARRPEFSPDGTWLVYTQRATRSPELRRIAVRGGRPSPIPGPWAQLPEISPDGRFIAAIDSQKRIGVISAADGSPVRSFEERSYAELRWTKDSRALAFARDGVVYLQSLDGSPPEKIVDVNPDELVSFDWTADGKSLILARMSQQRGAVMLKNFR